jgi:hypothetical protein
MGMRGVRLDHFQPPFSFSDIPSREVKEAYWRTECGYCAPDGIMSEQELILKVKELGDQLKQQSAKSSRKWPSPEWLGLRESRVPLCRHEVLVVENHVEK